MSQQDRKVTHRESESGGEFLIGREAVMTYRNAGDGHIIVNHTRVARESEGQGLAGVLFDAMVEYARDNNVQVTPTCSYVVHKFGKRPEDQDVLRKR